MNKLYIRGLLVASSYCDIKATLEMLLIIILYHFALTSFDYYTGDLYTGTISGPGYQHHVHSALTDRLCFILSVLCCPGKRLSPILYNDGTILQMCFILILRFASEIKRELLQQNICSL